MIDAALTRFTPPQLIAMLAVLFLSLAVCFHLAAEAGERALRYMEERRERDDIQ